MNEPMRRLVDDLILPTEADPETLGRIVGRYPGSEWLDLVASRATRGRSSAARLLKDLDEGTLQRVDATWLALFAWLAATVSQSEKQVQLALRAFEIAFTRKNYPDVPQPVYNTWLRALGLAGEFETAFPRPSENEVLATDWWAVHTDLRNPFLTAGRSLAEWLKAFNTPFVDGGVTPLTLAETDGLPLNRLRGTTADTVDGPLVSVIMPVFNPDESLLQAVSSILNQTWQNLEVLLVDDGSTRGEDLLSIAASLDSRVKLLPSSVNEGAYSARNRGLAAARGELVTFQDADDYSHPERITRHARELIDYAHVASVSRGIRATDLLQITTLNFRHISINLSSLMFRRKEVLQRLGTYDPVRRGADSEFSYRIQQVFGRDAVSRIMYPLAVLRLTPGSLSGGEVGLLQRHPARVAYRASSQGWHQEQSRRCRAPYVPSPARPPFPAPAHIRGEKPANTSADVLLLAPLEAGIAMDIAPVVDTLSNMGAHVALREHFAPVHSLQKLRESGNTIGGFLAAGKASWVLPDEEVNTPLAMVHEPLSILTMPVSPINAERIVLVMERFYSGEAIRIIDGRLRVGSSSSVSWLPATPQLAAHIQHHHPGANVLPPAWWRLPTVARMRTHYLPGTLGAVDSRFVGAMPSRSLLPDHTPIWFFGRARRRDFNSPLTRIPSNRNTWPSFLSQISALVHPETSAIPATTIDAWQSGTLVIAPPAMKCLFEDRALYCEQDIDALLVSLAEDPTPANEAIKAAQAYCDSYLSPIALTSTFMSLDTYE